MWTATKHLRLVLLVAVLGTTTAQTPALQGGWITEPTCGCVCDQSAGAACLSYPGYCADMWGRDLTTGLVTGTACEDPPTVGEGCASVACANAAPAAAAPTVATYALMQNGVCSSGFLAVRSRAECVAAATALALDDVEPAPVVLQPLLPQGCFYKSRTSSLYWNDNGVNNNLSPEMQSLCSDAPGCIMDQLPPKDASWGALASACPRIVLSSAFNSSRRLRVACCG